MSSGDDTISLLSTHDTNLCDQSMLEELSSAACSEFRDDYTRCKISECEVFGFIPTTTIVSLPTTQVKFKNIRNHSTTTFSAEKNSRIR